MNDTLWIQCMYCSSKIIHTLDHPGYPTEVDYADFENVFCDHYSELHPTIREEVVKDGARRVTDMCRERIKNNSLTRKPLFIYQ